MTARNLSSFHKYSRTVACIGRNYVDHAKELSNAVPTKPFFFLKPPSSILEPSQGPVLRPHGVELHYEVELAVIIGHKLQDLGEHDEEDAMAAIGGYALAIDMTARNLQDIAKKKGLPWTEAKGFDTFLPMSNFIEKDLIPDPHNVRLYLSTNGQERQSDSTNLMIFRIPRIISEISRVMTLDHGDIILTGTPKGVGEVKTGDLLTAGIEVNGKELTEGKIEVEIADRASKRGSTLNTGK